MNKKIAGIILVCFAILWFVVLIFITKTIKVLDPKTILALIAWVFCALLIMFFITQWENPKQEKND